MLKNIVSKTAIRHIIRPISTSIGRRNSSKDEKLLKEDITLGGVHLDEIDEILSDQALKPISHYPKLVLEPMSQQIALNEHKLMVIQPWISYANFGEFTDPTIQLDECVSLGNTIHNWSVVDKKLIFTNNLNRKHLLKPKAFEELKDYISSKPEITGLFFGVELLSGIQLSTLEKELKMSVFDRFTVVLNIFRQHAKTKEAKIQVALAELPYIRSHLREIHHSSEFSSSFESLKTLVGGLGEQFYQKRIEILKKRENRLRYLLGEISEQREITKKKRRKENYPTVAVVGYTNSGKTSLIKYLTQDEKLVPKDQLFATLDVTIHSGQLPSNKTVLYLDTVGFLSRIPMLLIEAFSATLKDCQESDLILHVLDVSHPDHRLQYTTVIKALEALKIPKNLLQTKITIGNKCDKLNSLEELPESLPKCDLQISVKNNIGLDKLVDIMNDQLMSNLNHSIMRIRVENGGIKYNWLRKHCSILECKPEDGDVNYLICRVTMSPIALGRWSKLYGKEDILADV